MKVQFLYLGNQSEPAMPLPPNPPAKPPTAAAAPLPAWRWPLILGLACIALALILGIAGPARSGARLPAWGFALGGVLLVWFSLGRRHRGTQTLASRSRERSWN